MRVAVKYFLVQQGGNWNNFNYFSQGGPLLLTGQAVLSHRHS